MQGATATFDCLPSFFCHAPSLPAADRKERLTADDRSTSRCFLLSAFPAGDGRSGARGGGTRFLLRAIPVPNGHQSLPGQRRPFDIGKSVPRSSRTPRGCPLCKLLSSRSLIPPLEGQGTSICPVPLQSPLVPFSPKLDILSAMWSLPVTSEVREIQRLFTLFRAIPRTSPSYAFLLLT